MIPAHLYFINSCKDNPRQMKLNKIRLLRFYSGNTFSVIMLNVHRIIMLTVILKVLLVLEMFVPTEYATEHDDDKI